MNTIKYKDIKKLLIQNSLELDSNISDEEVFLSIKTIANSSENDLSFFTNSKYLNDLKQTKAKACLIENQFKKYLPIQCKPIVLEDPYLALALISNLFNDQNFKSNGIISKKSNINSKSIIDKNVQINEFSTISENTQVHENTYIGSNSSIGPNVIINKNVIISDNVSISNAVIMENSNIKSGARIGGSGFGFDMKTRKKIYHSGNVIVGKNSSIGSNTTIDRAVFDSTILGAFSNIDNLVQIAHNVIIGDYAVIAAQVGIAGSATIGDRVVLGGQVGVADHVSIGCDSIVAGKSGVSSNVPQANPQSLN